ncbi:hypothetical protein ACFO3J_28145 [Streptomyces polygonati]|uniref:Uncharacterized protein n=1 Tax=Streptomyces polygonati TaxID=1617087 RepID=A0ABV8HTI1_9ACTN
MTGDKRTRIIIVELSENDTTDLPSLLRELVQVSSESLLVKGEIHMGDTYNVEQAGAVGPHSKATKNTFVKHQGDPGTFDLATLATQLATLRAALKSEAVDPEHDAAVGAVAQAEVSAKNGDEEGALAHLRAAGKWTLDIARKIGTEIAALAIAHAIAGG